MPTDLVFLIVTAVVGGLLVLGAALAAARARIASSAINDALPGSNGWGKYAPDPDVAEVEAAGPATASSTVVRVLWWVTIAAVLVGVGLSGSYRENQPSIFGLGGVAVVAVVVLHELLPRSWRNDLTISAEVAIALVLAAGLLLLTGYGASPYVFALDLLAVSVALGRGGWAAVLSTIAATGVYLGVLGLDPAADRFSEANLLRIALNIGSLWLLAFLAGVFASHQRRVRRMLSDLSRIDPLTGLFNRFQIYATLEQEVRRTRRSTRGFSLLMIDLDGLKAVNDSLGHQRGDEVLRALGRTIRGSIRTVDSAYRYGGDEFLVLLPETDFAGAFVVAEKIRGDAEEMGLRLEGEGVSTSVSVGLVSHPEDGATADELVRAADRAMYNAKALGKNQISGFPRPPRLAGPPPPPTEEERGPERAPERAPEPAGAVAPRPVPSVAASAATGPTVAVPVDAATEPPGVPEREPVPVEPSGSPEGPDLAAGEPPTSTEPPMSAVRPTGGEPPTSGGSPESPPFDERWTAVPEHGGPPRREPSDEEEPDAAEVRRQIAVASRSFDPDHQIRRAMDAFLSPPSDRPGRRPD